jgi:hypothetical protein
MAQKYNETMDGVHLKFARMLIWFMRVFDLFLTEVHFEDGSTRIGYLPCLAPTKQRPLPIGPLSSPKSL